MSIYSKYDSLKAKFQKYIAHSSIEFAQLDDPVIRAFMADKCLLEDGEELIVLSNCLAEPNWIAISDRRIFWGNSQNGLSQGVIWDRCDRFVVDEVVPDYASEKKLYRVIPIENIASKTIYRIDVEPRNFSLFWILIREVLSRNRYLRSNRDSYLTNDGFKTRLRAIWESKDYAGNHGSVCQHKDGEVVFTLQLAHGQRLVVQFGKVSLYLEPLESVAIDAANIAPYLDFADDNALAVPVDEHCYRIEFLTFTDFLLCRSLFRAFIERKNIDYEITRVSDLLMEG